MTRSTRGSESTHFSSACAQVSIPKLAKRRQLLGRGRAAKKRRSGSAERAHHDDGDPELCRERQQPLLGLALVEVQRQLDDVEAAGPQRALELAERACAPVRDADAIDAARGPLLLEPREVLLPRDEVVHLLDLDPTEEASLLLVLRAALVEARGPDLRCDARAVPSASRARCRATTARRRTSATSRRSSLPLPVRPRPPSERARHLRRMSDTYRARRPARRDAPPSSSP